MSLNPKKSFKILTSFFSLYFKKNYVIKFEKNLTSRIDKLGRQLAYLEDDAPTREEHDNLEKRVVKVEQKPVSA